MAEPVRSGRSRFAAAVRSSGTWFGRAEPGSREVPGTVRCQAPVFGQRFREGDVPGSRNEPGTRVSRRPRRFEAREPGSEEVPGSVRCQAAVFGERQAEVKQGKGSLTRRRTRGQFEIAAMSFSPYLRRAVAAAAVLALAVGASAGAKTWAVTITKNGYVPNSLSIATGDVVTFTNSDSVAHQVSFKQSTGFTCAPTSLVLQPAASGTCT